MYYILARSSKSTCFIDNKYIFLAKQILKLFKGCNILRDIIKTEDLKIETWFLISL